MKIYELWKTQATVNLHIRTQETSFLREQSVNISTQQHKLSNQQPLSAVKE